MTYEKKLIDKKELAKALKVSVSTIDRYRADGMPFVKIGEKLIRFDLDDVLTWIIDKTD